MFSEEDKIKAVLHFIKFELKAEATVRALGYPCSKTLKAWHREYVATGTCRLSKARKTRFTAEKQKTAVTYYIEHGRCTAATIRVLGYPGPDTFRKWLRIHDAGLVKSAERVSPFSEEEKRRAVVSLCLREKSALSIAQEVGVSRFRLYTWKNQLLGDLGSVVAKSRKSSDVNTGENPTNAEIHDLQLQIRALKLERDMLLKANELLKKETGIDPRDMSNREKTRLVDALRAGYSISEILTRISLPSSSYFYNRKRLAIEDRHKSVRSQITLSFQESDRNYGYR